MNSNILSIANDSSYEDIINTYDYMDYKPSTFFSPIKSTKVKKLPSEPEISNFEYNMNINGKLILSPKKVSNYNTFIKKTLVLDLDETLVHSSMTPFPNGSHIIININVNDKTAINNPVILFLLLNLC